MGVLDILIHNEMHGFCPREIIVVKGEEEYS
jgi:hypothetical protein